MLKHSIEIVPYIPEMYSIWEAFCEQNGATFQHTRSFLDYHGQRFIERSVLLKRDNKLVAIFPAGSVHSNEREVISHPGATYSGLVCSTAIYGNELIHLYQALCSYYGENGIKSLEVKLTPTIYLADTLQDEEYALWHLGGHLSRVELAACVFSDNRLKVSSQRRRSYKSALNNNLYLSTDFANVGEFYEILCENLFQKYRSKPIHSLQELQQLKERLGDVIQLSTVHTESGMLISGVLFFCCDNGMHAQYIASSNLGYELNGLDFLFENSIRELNSSKRQFLSFGTSNEEQGMVLNGTLYRFKRQFGAGSITHRCYKLGLR